MLCPKCNTFNNDDTKFCVGCGSPLTAPIPVQSVQPIQQFQQVPYTPIPQVPYEPIQPAQPKNNKLSIVGFVLSMCGFLTCAITAIPGLICSIVGLIQCSKKKNNGKGFAIAGIAISVFCIVLVSACFGMFADITNKMYSAPGYYYEDDDDDDYTIETTKHTRETTEETTDWTTEATTEPTYKIVDTSYITNVMWVETQADSCLIFNGNNFNYYQTYKDLNDNYYTGTYNIFVGEVAIDKVTTDYSQYGVTRQELDNLFAKNTSITKDNFVCIMLNNTGCWQNGQNTRDEQWVRPFYGFYMKVNNHYEMVLVQMNTGDYYAFVDEAYYREHYMAPKETATEPTTTETTETSKPTQQVDGTLVGDDIVGYVVLDGDWKVWKEADGNDSLYASRVQRINVETGTIVQLSVFKDKVSASSLKTVADNLETGLASSCHSITNDKTKIAGYDAYIITGNYPDGTYLTVWVFVDSNSYLHYITVEYTTQADYDMVKNTYRLT